MQPEQTIRLECLRLALAQTGGPSETIQRAQAYENYVRGGDKAEAPPPAFKEKPQDKGNSRRN